MADKHYNINYLEDTGRVLKDLKKSSYSPFLGISKGIIADLGCGTGLDVINMSKMVNPEVKVIGVDHDPVMLEKANASVGDIANVEFILSEVYESPFTNNSIDGVRAERLIQHLKEPQKAVDKMYQVLKKDRPIVIVETDWRSLVLYNENVDTEEKLNNYLTKEKINNGRAARKLNSYLENSNFRDIKLEVFPFVVKTLREANEYLWVGHILKEMEEKKLFNPGEYDLFMASLDEADKKGYFACSINLVVVSGTK